MNSPLLYTNKFESILLSRAKGTWVWDTNNKKYLDCESGMWCVNLGHNQSQITSAINKQMQEIIHRNKGFLTPITITAAEIVLAFMPTKFDKITFLNSGSEAVEFAINFAKKVTKRDKVISLEHSYLGAFGIAKKASFTSSKDAKFKLPFEMCSSAQCECREKYTELLEEIFSDKKCLPACFVFEPIIVSGGIYKPCKNFIEMVCEKIQENDGLVIIDEVTTGFGRTGNRFGYELYDIRPDIVVVGKAFGNGYPVSAVITKTELENKLTAAELYYAQSHQLDPVGAAVAKTVIEIFQKDKIIEKSQDKMSMISDFIDQLSYPFIQDVRHFGMIFAIEFKGFKEIPPIDLVLKIKDELLNEGIIAGYSLRNNLIRFLPPLTITTKEIQFLKEKLTRVFDSILKQNQ